MKSIPNAAPAANLRRIRNTDQGPNAVENAITLVTKLQQAGWTNSEISYRHVVSSWTGDSYDAIDLEGTRLADALAELLKI